ncbi:MULTISPECIES: hypothetical protein [unclassified Frankia]|uniref:hypothetical protein n=1 Tax=unclassified Frankia TaxID=2632575 RepID=UPI002AD38D23|nr:MULTISPECIES: hypothetical protein [unclassified Frankia]
MDDRSVLPTDVLDELFSLDPQVSPLGELAGFGDSGDCTNDGCTGSCVGCS